MACYIKHELFHQQNPHLHHCTSCGEDLEAPPIDLTASSPPGPPGPVPKLEARPETTTSMSIPAADAHNRPPLTFPDALKKAKEERMKGQKTKQEPRVISNDVSLALFFCTEVQIVTKSGFRINKLKSMLKGPQMSAIPEPVNIPHHTHRSLIRYLFSKWNVDRQYRQQEGWEIVGHVTLGNGQGYTSLALDKMARVRLMDIRKAGGQDNGKDKFTVNLLHRTVLGEIVESDEEPPVKKTKGKAKAKPVQPVKRQVPSRPNGSDESDGDMVDIATAERTGNPFGKVTSPVSVRLKEEPATPIKQERHSNDLPPNHSAPPELAPTQSEPEQGTTDAAGTGGSGADAEAPVQARTGKSRLDLPPPMKTRAARKKRSHSDMDTAKQE